MDQIEILREKIDKIDEEIIKNLAHRDVISKQIGHLKSLLHREIVDECREQTLRMRREELSNKYHIDSKFIQCLFKLIIIHSRRLQK